MSPSSPDGSNPAPADAAGASFPEIRVSAGWTLAGLGAGLAGGALMARVPGGAGALGAVQAVLGPVGRLWLHALEMTILPLVASLLVLGVAETMAAARGGAIARRTLGTFAGVLVAGAVMAALVTPLLLEWSPVPAAAAEALRHADAGTAPLPGIGAFVESLVPANVVTAAAGDAVLPVIVFFALFAVALAQVAEAPRRQLLLLFEGLAGAMLVVIGWVLWLAPVGVLALAFGVAAAGGGAAFGVLAHYIAVVFAVGTVVFVGAHAIAMVAARIGPLAYLRAMLPVEAVALSTQSSLASLPAMLGACRSLGVRQAHAEFVLPLSVALFRATGPAMNLAVAIYVAKLAGVALTPAVLAAGIAAACLTTMGAPSLPGAISYVSSVGPIAIAMGAPVAPLALLVAVEMVPDLMRTLGNVAMDVAVTAWIDRRMRRDPA